MPKVPTYDAPQEQLHPLGAPRQDSVASPDLLGAQARNTEALGKGMLAAGTGLSAIAYKMQEREDADSVFRAETALKDEYIKYEQDVRKTRQGRFAKDLTTDTEKWWDERLQEHTKGLGNGNQQRVFSERATRLRQQSVGAVSQWEAGQLEKSHDESWQASKASTIGIAAATPTPQAIDSARLEIDRLNQYQARRKGWEPEKLAAEVIRDKTVLHAQVIQGLARTDPVAAKVYFDKFKDEIDGTKHAELGEFAEKVSANAIGETKAGEVWSTLGPKDDRTPVELDKMEEQLRKDLKGNEPALDSAIRRLRERVQAHKDSRRERDEGFESSVNKAILDGASMSQIARMPEFNRLSPESARKISEHMERQAATRAARGAAEAQRTEAMEGIAERKRFREGAEAAFRIRDPEVLASMTRDQVVNLLPTLGREHTNHLLEKWDGFHKSPEKLTEARIDKQLFDSIALEVGLRPNEPKKDEKEKDQLVRLQNHVEVLIGTEQRAKGRQLSRDEKAKVMREALDNKVLVDEWGRDPKKPLSVLSTDELKDAYVMVGEKQVRIASIPATDRAGIESAARRAGKTPTEQLIAEKWLELQAIRAKGK